MSVTLEWCRTCELAYDPSEQATNIPEMTLGQIHRKHCEVIVEYDPKIHDSSSKNKVLTPDLKEKYTKENAFTNHLDSKGQKIKILDTEIDFLKPLYLDETGTRWILIWVPVSIEDTKTGNITKYNRAVFISNDGTRKESWYYDSLELKEQFVVNVSSSEKPRWKVKDVRNYFSSSKKIDPKLVYENLISSQREFFEYQDDNDYHLVNIWNIGTYFYDLFNCFPYLDFDASKGSGKTKNLDYQCQICYNAIKSSNITGSSQFRIIEGTGATILYDEIETLANPKKQQDFDTIQILHSGFMKGDRAYRTEGSNFEQKSYDTYSPKGLAHINSIGDVTEDRCIRIDLLRSFNQDILAKDVDFSDPRFQAIRDSLYRLSLDYADEIYGLISEARKLLVVTGRELKLWTPIITLALFFERHGVEGLTDKIIVKCNLVHEKRIDNDSENSPEGKIILIIHEKLRGKQVNENDGIQFQEIQNTVKQHKEEYGFDESFKIGTKWLVKKITQLGFSKIKRTEDGWFYNISNQKIDDALKRMGISYQATLGDGNAS